MLGRKPGAEWPDPTDNVNSAYGKGENCIATSITDGRDYALSRSRRRRSVNTSERLRQRTIDYMKYLATVALMEVPSSIPPALYGPFYKGCPAGAEKQASFLAR